MNYEVRQKLHFSGPAHIDKYSDRETADRYIQSGNTCNSRHGQILVGVLQLSACFDLEAEL